MMGNISKCKTPYCKNRACKELCAKCLSRKYRADNPVKYAFDTLKHNAKRRGVNFEISFEYFQAFCQATDYMRGKGKTAQSFTVDRIDNHLGYVVGNLQVLTLRDNVKKMHLEYCWQTKTAHVHTYRPVMAADNPF